MQGDTFRHELADDDRGERDGGDDEAQRDGASPGPDVGLINEFGREAIGEGAAAEGAGEHADEGDADLYGGEHASGLGGHGEGALGASVAVFRQLA